MSASLQSQAEGSGCAALLTRARGALLGLALGDALGSTVEFMTPREIGAQYGVHDRIRGGGWLRLQPGDVTDDTGMTLALAQAWIAAGGPPSAESCARFFDQWMRAKPVDIGNTVRRGIVRWRLTGSTEAPPSTDAGNGATMRCLPVALAGLGADRATIAHAALTQARVTHHNHLTDAATLCVVDMVQLALEGADQRAVLRRAAALVEAFPDFTFGGRRAENPSGYIVDTMRAVCQAMTDRTGYEAVLVDIVNRGGDADTTAAIAGMIMGAIAGEEGLPVRWLTALRPPVRTTCLATADRLARLAPAWQTSAAQA